mmetsp:Transcript_17370/g.50716  ORF Transcript_17370/g.50716 Transcript_17370/m.50716 type:complete len:275 (+) Transcript_17370:435-1259(+)
MVEDIFVVSGTISATLCSALLLLVQQSSARDAATWTELMFQRALVSSFAAALQESFASGSLDVHLDVAVAAVGVSAAPFQEGRAHWHLVRATCVVGQGACRACSTLAPEKGPAHSNLLAVVYPRAVFPPRTTPSRVELHAQLPLPVCRGTRSLGRCKALTAPLRVLTRQGLDHSPSCRKVNVRLAQCCPGLSGQRRCTCCCSGGGGGRLGRRRLVVTSVSSIHGPSTGTSTPGLALTREAAPGRPPPDPAPSLTSSATAPSALPSGLPRALQDL